MARKFHERRSLSSALHTYLAGKGWDIGSKVLEGFQSGETVVAPVVSVYFQPNAINELEIGRVAKTFTRRVQIDAYMKNEATAEAIGDDIMDFLDDVPITVKDTETNEDLASMIVYDTRSITSETVPPILKEAKVKHWRNVSKATYEVHYFDA